jgi:serine/threonine protein kinase
MGVAANTMRRVLADYAHAHKAEHRGGMLQKVELKEELVLSSDEVRRRFRREALALAKLTHSHIAAIYDVSEENGIDFIEMDDVSWFNISVDDAALMCIRDAGSRHGIYLNRERIQLTTDSSKMPLALSNTLRPVRTSTPPASHIWASVSVLLRASSMLRLRR